MPITFDAKKDVRNVSKHGVSLAIAEEFEWDFALTWPDKRHSYGEDRESALVLYGQRLYFVAFVDRPTGRHVITLPKANDREVRFYARHN